MKTEAKTTGLRYWMLRVLDECERAAADFKADPVHDLRVTLRRCRSMADGMIAMDPDAQWKAMKKAGKRLFQSLGQLRDTQIMMEWIEKLAPTIETADRASSAAAQAAESAESSSAERHEDSPRGDAAVHALVAILRRREHEQKQDARTALEDFDRKQWRQWSKTLPRRAARIRPGSPVFKHLALERWMAARELQKVAFRNRSQVALHTLRIGIKRFRYIVENFLPAEHKVWCDDLKHMQDLLGEVHDLDVLWATALACHVFSDEDLKRRWHARIIEERAKRTEEYRQKMTGPDSLWNVWRAGLPQGKQIQAIAMTRMKMWAKALDPDFAHSERVAKLALELYDGLTAAGFFGEMAASDGGASLTAAALLHDVGKSKGQKGHHKASLELIKSHGTPLGWTEEDMRRAAIVARFHCGALPTRRHKQLRDLLPPEQKITIRLAAVLRLANAFDAEHDGQIRRLEVENANGRRVRAAHFSAFGRRGDASNGFPRNGRAVLGSHEAVVIDAEGYTPASPTAQAIAAERHLLETVLRRPVLVKAASAPRRPASALLRSA